jgi:3-hydroxyacyl-[acyl-carrier-protein] dehydratase
MSGLDKVIETVACIAGEPPERLRDRCDADLSNELGIDSIHILGIWCDLEERFGIPQGELGISQPMTIRAIAQQLDLRNGKDSDKVFDRAAIEALIPHREPILMLDRAYNVEPGERGLGERLLKSGDACFAGHFPGDPIVPGAFILEACGQLLAVICRVAAYRGAWNGHAPPVDYLASVERFKFLSPARPGELLTMEAEVGRRTRSLLQAHVSARVAQRPVAQGILNVTVQRGGARA